MTFQSFVEERKERSLTELIELLRIPSVSTDSAHKSDVARCSELVAERLTEAGLATKIYPTKGHPVVYGERIDAPGKPTVLIYGHYDVQPPDPLDLWRHGPFEPTMEGEYLVARGATDDKGQFYALVKGVQAAIETLGTLPVNVKMLIEGEEEIGSPSLGAFIDEHKERLACDVIVISDCAQFGVDQPAITYGLKGLCYMEMTVTGPGHDLHSGAFGGAVANPGNVLARLLAACQDEDGNITIPGFYDDVRDLSDEERRELAALPFDEKVFLETTGARKVHGEPGFTTVERKGVRPTFDVNGLISGFTGEGAKTVLPSVAKAKFSMRLVPDQDPKKIGELAMNYLRSLVPESVTVQIRDLHGANPVVVPRDGKFVAAAETALERAFGSKPYYVREGGSIPIVNTFREKLGVDSLLLGLGLPNDRPHSPNEQFRIKDFYRGQVMMAAFLEEMAAT